MDRLRRVPLAAQVEAALESAIEAGELGPQLPGHRELESMLGVSRTAIRPALASLVERGVLVQPGPRKRFRVAEGRGPANKRPATRKVVIVEVNAFGERMKFSSEIAADLAGRSAVENWTIDHTVVRADQSRDNSKKLQRMLDASGADALIVVAGTRKTLDWACGCGVPALALGGDDKGIGIPSVGYCTDSMVTIALDRLLECGHRDICMPVAVDSPTYVAQLEAGMVEAFGRCGATFHPKLHFPKWHSNTPEAWRDGLRWRFGVTPPDALVLLGTPACQVSIGVLMELGLRVPDDVSLVAIAEEKNLNWFHPRLACFDLNPLSLSDKIAGWIKSPHAENKSLILPPKWVEGSSIRARAQK